MTRKKQTINKQFDQPDAEKQRSSSQPETQPSAQTGLEETETGYSLWDDLRHSIPPWLGEIIGITLVIFSILSFLALFDTSGGVVAIAWSQIISGLFGLGGLLVSIGLFAMGLMILSPRIGFTIQLSQLQILAIEILSLSILAIFHLLSGETELQTTAHNSRGGGLIGWAISAPFFALLGREIALLVIITLFTISLIIALGVRRVTIARLLNQSGIKLENLSQRFAPFMITSPPENQPKKPALDPEFPANRRMPLMRIRPDSHKHPVTAEPRATPPENPRRIDLRKDPEPEKETLDYTNHPLFVGEAARNRIRADFNAIGELTGEKDRAGIPLIQRPDGRIKRYFKPAQKHNERKVEKRPALLPSLELLKNIELQLPHHEEINHNVVLIENTLLEFDIDIDVVDVQVGPTVTRYAIQPYKLTHDGREIIDRTRIRKILGYANDLALSLSAKRLRIEAPVPGEHYMGIEVPNRKPGIVSLRSLIESRVYYNMTRRTRSPLVVPLGLDVAGNPVAIDLAQMPHLLIAGTTGSGKSVCITSIITSLILNNPPDKVNMVMIDPKMVELRRFNGLPHLLGPVETDTERSVGMLRWCAREMDRRYKILEEHSARNIEALNTGRGKKDYLPYLVILIDEMGDIMLSAPEETEKYLTRLAQMARAVGIHLVVATQRPSADVITGLIKANFPSRISFAVPSSVDSRVIIDTAGAENLMGKGDMLYLSQDSSEPRRIQGCFVSDDEATAVIQHWENWRDRQIQSGRMKPQTTPPWEKGVRHSRFLADTDPMIEDAIRLVVQTREASASLLQRRLDLGYPRAARIIDLLQELGVVGAPVTGGRNREVLIPATEEDPVKLVMEQRRKKQ